jgi:RNA polymerase sigma-70 factor (ECF subfamily)
MVQPANSTTTRDLLERVRGKEADALGTLFARYRERLRKMVRLRLDRRLRARFDSSSVLELVRQDVARRVGEYLAKPSTSFFLWLRMLTGRRIQELHFQHLGTQALGAGQELCLYRGTLPTVNSLSLAAQLMGERVANQTAARAEQVLRLEQALNTMDALDREILTLCHFEELDTEESATVLEIDREMATKHYLRALKRLGEILKSIPGFGDAG